MEKVAHAMLAGGLCCFALAGVVSGYLPIAHLNKIKMQTIEEVTPEVPYDFKKLAERYPEEFKRHYGEVNMESFKTALRLGKDVYIGEACWHCHSQFVRPVANEDIRFGKVSWAGEYMNEMFLPHLFGTRRVGPDLIREAGRHANDWHVAHFFEPTIIVPTSVMPRYTWFFDGEVPNKKGIAIITYVQWLGSWATPEVLAHKEGQQ